MYFRYWISPDFFILYSPAPLEVVGFPNLAGSQFVSRGAAPRGTSLQGTS